MNRKETARTAREIAADLLDKSINTGTIEEMLSMDDNFSENDAVKVANSVKRIAEALRKQAQKQ